MWRCPYISPHNITITSTRMHLSPLAWISLLLLGHTMTNVLPLYTTMRWLTHMHASTDTHRHKQTRTDTHRHTHKIWVKIALLICGDVEASVSPAQWRLWLCRTTELYELEQQCLYLLTGMERCYMQMFRDTTWVSCATWRRQWQ